MNDRLTYPQMALSLLRPTQITAGLRYVRSKALITARNRTRLAEFMMEHPVKLAIGPDNEPYVLDHHHWALAWQLAGHTTAPVRIVADYSGVTGEEFWSTLVARRLVHPFGVDGTRQPVAALPPGLRELKDDIYQSIAAFARRAGAYRKPATPSRHSSGRTSSGIRFRSTMTATKHSCLRLCPPSNRPGVVGRENFQAISTDRNKPAHAPRLVCRFGLFFSKSCSSV